MANFFLEIITPERKIFSGEAEMVTAPSTTGTIGILKGHTALFTKLIEGEIKILGKDGEVYLAIGSGFMEVSSDKVTVLVSSAFKADEINEKMVLEAKKRAEEVIAAKPTGEALREAETMFRRSLIELKVARRRKTRIQN